ncbi:aconitate hydratase [Xanthovirga aplysinae]|uniref:aconitate hydratase n=1 Tax=Xanthovirga aplysinae TaxID=2529853 RepID=UPI0012BC78A9|nr:aconitate hydratase [Xanthovirga aplysinae]MTI32110.1 aconitate hydratase [Xanthovirga aplysinae]
MNATHKLLHSHLISGKLEVGTEIGLRIDHILQQDATGTLVMLELESLGLARTKAEVAVQYVDHNLLQTDFRNADDHRFLQSASARFGYWFSRSGNGISHAVHMERFGIPGKTLLGSDSHTCAGGGLGMLAIGTGGLDVALASAGEPYFVKMPKVLGVKLTGLLPDWVSAKDVVLEMLRRHDVKGGRGFIIEYFGEGLKTLSTWDRHVIANMGTEMGATTSVFPSDEITRFFLKQQKREKDWVELEADSEEEYDELEEIHLNDLIPLIACPSSPGKVVPVKKVKGTKAAQVVVGSSANPGLRDFAVVSEILKNKTIASQMSLDINPSSRQTFQNLIEGGRLAALLQAGGRIHQTGCMGCIGMGQAPASGSISLRTMPRNFPGRSGTLDDQVYLCSPETAAATALCGEITDPRDLENRYQMIYPKWKEPKEININTQMLLPPPSLEESQNIQLIKGPNIKGLPEFSALEDGFEVSVLLKMADNISTDEILKAGSDVLPLRSNVEELSKFSFYVIDQSFYERSQAAIQGHVVIAGENYAQGSSREHAALCPRFLGQKAVLAKSYARIGWQNLINFGIIPFEFVHPQDYEDLTVNDKITFKDLKKKLSQGERVTAHVVKKNKDIELTNRLSERQIKIILAGGLINYIRSRLKK